MVLFLLLGTNKCIQIRFTPWNTYQSLIPLLRVMGGTLSIHFLLFTHEPLLNRDDTTNLDSDGSQNKRYLPRAVGE